MQSMHLMKSKEARIQKGVRWLKKNPRTTGSATNSVSLFIYLPAPHTHQERHKWGDFEPFRLRQAAAMGQGRKGTSVPSQPWQPEEMEGNYCNKVTKSTQSLQGTLSLEL